MKKKKNTALLLIVVIGIAILIGSLAMMLPDVEDAPEDTDRTPTVTTDTAAPGDPEDPSEPEDTVKNGYTISVQNTNSSWVYADGIETDDAYLYGKRVIEFVQDVGYRHPDKVLVIGASSTWYKGTGYLEIYNATSDVTVIYEPVQTFKVTLNATNCNIASDVKIVDWAGTASFTVKPNAGYKLDHIENMSWTGSCTKFAYDNDSGVLTVGGIVSDLTITVTPEYTYRTLAFDEGLNVTYTVNNVSGSVLNFEGEWIYAFTIVPVEGYKISNISFEGIVPTSYRTDVMVDGKNVGAAFVISHSDSQSSYDFKVNVTVTKLPQTYNVVFENTEYFTVHDYSSKDGSIGYYTFQGSYKYCWTFAPIDGYEIGMIKVEGLTPKAMYWDYPVNGQNIGGYLELSGTVRPTGDVKITVVPAKLPDSVTDSYALKFTDNTFGDSSDYDFDVDSLDFSAGDTVKFIVYHNNRYYDYFQLYSPTDQEWIGDGFDYSVIGGYGFSIITITFANGDLFKANFGSSGNIELIFNTVEGPDTSYGHVTLDAQCSGGGGVGTAEPWRIAPGDTALIPCYPDEDGMAIDGWSCDLNSDFWSAEWVEINGSYYVLFTLSEDFSTESASEIQFYVWFA